MKLNLGEQLLPTSRCIFGWNMRSQTAKCLGSHIYGFSWEKNFLQKYFLYFLTKYRHTAFQRATALEKRLSIGPKGASSWMLKIKNFGGKSEKFHHNSDVELSGFCWDFSDFPSEILDFQHSSRCSFWIDTEPFLKSSSALESCVPVLCEKK